ncbi:MAG: hypothetical protein ACKVS6_00810 [Planctomycetota bacterium]
MLHPSQFKVNEAWIAFQLNDEPVSTQQDGEFNFLALMDSASCFLLSFTPVAAAQSEPTKLGAKRLLKEGYAHKNCWPKTLFVPTELAAQFLIAEAERLGIGVVRVAEDQLLLFIGEAKEGFNKRFGMLGP